MIKSQEIPFSKVTYPSIDNIRMISMISIVFLHSSLLVYSIDNSKALYPDWFNLLYLGILQIGRFGNICFFLVSGLLFGAKTREKSEETKKNQYVKKRINILIKPTVLFFFINLISQFVLYAIKEILHTQNVSHIRYLDISISDIIKSSLVSEWFIITFFAGLYILSKKYGNSKIIFILLTVITLFIGINSYLNWVLVDRNYKGFIGFVFYMYLGYYLGKYPDYYVCIINWIKLNKYLYLFLLVCALSVAILDNLYLYTLPPSWLPIFNLKLSNQIYSLLILGYMFAFFEKPILPDLLNPRKETIGIYFIHQIMLIFVSLIKKVILVIFKLDYIENISYGYLLVWSISCFLIVYITSFFIVKWLIPTKYSSLIGISIT